MVVMTLPTDPSPSTMNPPQTTPFSPAPLLTPLQAPPLVSALAPPQGGGSLLESDDNDEDFKEDEDFNKERDNCEYLYERESLQDEIELVYKEYYHAEEEDFNEYMNFNE